MADSYPPFTTRPSTKANTIHRNDGSNNCTRRFLGKSLFFTFFLISIPLFPSQAPDFINQTVLNKFWELIHLLFIGIAVSYGLFGRRSNADNASHDDSHSYASGISHFSSVFEDDFDHSMYYSAQGKAGSFNDKNGSFENPYVENVVQAWSSKYVQGESMVVLAQPHCELGSFVDHKPLGLPVRSLKSRVELGNGSSELSDTSAVDSSDSSNKSEGEKSSDLGSESLEGKYNGSDVLGSPIPWRSISVRMRQRVGGGGGGATRPSHFRPLSVDETQFQSLKSRSFHSELSPHSPSSLSPSHSSTSESPNYDELKEFSDKKKDDSSSGTKEWISGYPLKFDAKPVAPSKASSKRKPFRTFRGSGCIRGERELKFGRYNLSSGFKRQHLENNSDIQNPTFSKNQNREQPECSGSSRSENSDEETMGGTLSVAGSDSYEVDRKAGEFIAKFREQIRLQRTTSIDSLKGLNTYGNFFR
ncbi:Phosphotyrosine protein phosphatases superfamily protein [Hibiscus syriacus]|uniref:Phosphotyrosine protein phosphatases superfamily protein n=1 Tax=Hibiscus syriacus TaxID=106335 RepID=A0A6A3A963_HIBSY|nr:uncharacterized protein LOC120132949 [Hibiscus syriacus]KAE8699705.1 Phosphotyrosine protein phosphatases superfamily protein [Hibiscus syriacus]